MAPAYEANKVLSEQIKDIASIIENNGKVARPAYVGAVPLGTLPALTDQMTRMLGALMAYAAGLEAALPPPDQRNDAPENLLKMNMALTTVKMEAYDYSGWLPEAKEWAALLSQYRKTPLFGAMADFMAAADKCKKITDALTKDAGDLYTSLVGINEKVYMPANALQQAKVARFGPDFTSAMAAVRKAGVELQQAEMLILEDLRQLSALGREILGHVKTAKEYRALQRGSPLIPRLPTVQLFHLILAITFVCLLWFWWAPIEHYKNIKRYSHRTPYHG